MGNVMDMDHGHELHPSAMVDLLKYLGEISGKFTKSAIPQITP